MFVQPYEYTENHRIVHIVKVDIIVCEMYLNEKNKKSGR